MTRALKKREMMVDLSPEERETAKMVTYNTIRYKGDDNYWTLRYGDKEMGMARYDFERILLNPDFPHVLDFIKYNINDEKLIFNMLSEYLFTHMGSNIRKRINKYTPIRAKGYYEYSLYFPTLVQPINVRRPLKLIIPNKKMKYELENLYQEKRKDGERYVEWIPLEEFKWVRSRYE